MDINKSVSNYLISLIKATVQDEMPVEKPEDVSWSKLLELAHFHKVEEMAFYSITKLNDKPTDKDQSAWFSAHEKNQLVDVLQQEEHKLIVDAVTKAGIGILPLKGIVLKPYYRMSLFREQGDIDYMIEPGQIDDVVPIMTELGYDAKDVGKEDSTDDYAKLPYMEVEMHRRLFPPTEENHWYTDDIWDRVRDNDENKYLKTLSWEDVYIYHLLHFEKHFSMGGSGIKYLVDHYLFKTKLKDRIDWDKVAEILPTLNYVELEKMMDELAEAWFGDGEMTEALEGPAHFIITSGAFGTFEHFQEWSYNRYKDELGVKSKKGYFFKRMFMERERMEFSYPILKKHGWLLPFLWVHRLFSKVFGNWGRVKRELDDFSKKDGK